MKIYRTLYKTTIKALKDENKTNSEEKATFEARLIEIEKELGIGQSQLMPKKND